MLLSLVTSELCPMLLSSFIERDFPLTKKCDERESVVTSVIRYANNCNGQRYAACFPFLLIAANVVSDFRASKVRSLEFRWNRQPCREKCIQRIFDCAINLAWIEQWKVFLLCPESRNIATLNHLPKVVVCRYTTFHWLIMIWGQSHDSTD